MAPTHKKPDASNTATKSRRILGCFGLGSKMIKKDPAKSEEKVVDNWEKCALKVVHDHPPALPVAKPFLVEKTNFIDHESLEKKDGIEKFLRKLSLDQSKSNQMIELNDVSKPKEDVPGLQIKGKRRSRHWRRREGDEAIAAMSILMLILIVMLLCGRLCAIFCASIWFYCAPRFIKTVNKEKKEKKKKKKTIDGKDEKSIELVVDSDAYRKKVVLHGLLERTHSKVCYMGKS